MVPGGEPEIQVGMTHEPVSRGESPSETDRDRAPQECRGTVSQGRLSGGSQKMAVLACSAVMVVVLK